MAVVLRQLVTNLMPSVSGGAYQDARKVSLVWNDIQNIDACLNSEAERTKRVQALFSPPSFLLREKRWGRRRRVRNDHDGTNPCKQGFLSSVLVSSFPNRKLNLRFGSFLCKSATTSQARSLCHYWYASSPGRGAFYSRMQIMPPVFSLIMRPRVLVSFCRASSGMRMILAVTPSETSS